MAIKRGKFNRYNGSDFDTYHMETQASQVKTLDANGNVSSSIEELLLKGKPIQNTDLNTIKTTGLYRIKGCSNTPGGLDSGKTYIMIVRNIDNGSGSTITYQEIYDHVNQNGFERSIEGSTVKSWVNAGKAILDKISNLESSVGNLSSLGTSNKTNIVSALNEVNTRSKNNATSILNINGEINDINRQLGVLGENKYLNLNGGDLAGTITMANDHSFAGKNTSGVGVNLAKVTGGNNVDIGDPSLELSLHASAGKAKVYDGTNTFRIFHSGNMGSGSGLDADKVDGLHGSQLARKDGSNYFTENQYIENGKSLYIRASDGSANTGNIYWRKKDNTDLARLSVEEDGEMRLQAGGVTGFRVKPGGYTYTTYDHVLVAKDRQVAIRFKLDDNDKGAGLYMNNNSKQVGFYDWEKNDWYFTTNRSTRVVEFSNQISIQGHQLFIQYSEPSTGMKDGDVWIDINAS